MKTAVAVVILCAAVSLAHPRAAAAPRTAAPDACSLLDSATLKQVLGVDSQPGKAGASYFAGNTNCQITLANGATVSIIATTSAVQATSFSPGSNAARFKGSAPLPGVGDRAFIWPATANEGVVEFLKGTTEVDLRVSNMNKVLTPDQLTALAKAALAKL